MTIKEIREKVKDMPSYIIDDDYVMYHRYIPLIPKDETILDIGTGWGKSAVIMALLNSDILIRTFDNGSYPIYQGWAKDKQEYGSKLYQEFEKYGVYNIQLIVNDIDKFENNFFKFKLIHFDMMAESERQALGIFLPQIEKNGLAFIRNYERMKDKVDDLLTDFELIDKSGLIWVWRRVK